MVISLRSHLSLGNDWGDYLKLLHYTHLGVVLIELKYFVSLVVLGGLGRI